MDNNLQNNSVSKRISSGLYKANLDNDSQNKLSQMNYLLISNYIINECTKKYHQEYSSLQIPLSYIEFYFYQISRYSNKFNNYIKLYFEKLNDNSNFEKLLNVYCRTFSKVAHTDFINQSGLHLVMNKKHFPINVSFNTDDNQDLESTFNLLDSIVENILKNEEERSLKSQYLDFLKKQLSNKDRKVLQPILQKNKLTSSKPSVERFILPKFKLGLNFPTSHSKSRVDSLLVASKFIDPIKTIEILQRFGIVAVKIENNFITKRVELFKQKKIRFS